MIKPLLFAPQEIKVRFTIAQSLYEGCTLKSIAENVGYITAQIRPMLSIETGFSITNIKVIGNGQVYLGRLWRACSLLKSNFLLYLHGKYCSPPMMGSHYGQRPRPPLVYTNYYANCYLCVNGGLHTTENINVVDLDPTLLQELPGFTDWQTERSIHSLAFTSLKEILR
ncbi:pectinesterase [Trifolium repens]|nr:pectinesterase [Trifolium repens]